MSKVNISKLNIQITASSEGLRVGVNGANQEIKKLEKQGVKATDVLKKMGIGFGVVAAAAGSAAFAGKKFWNFLRDIQGELDATIKQATRLGMTFDELASLRFAGGELAGQAGAMDDAIREMQQRAARAVEGDDSLRESFRKLGIDAGEALTSGPVDAIEKIADGMSRINSQGERLRLTQEVFGRSGTKVVALLQEGADAIRESVEFHQKWNSLTEAQTLGIEANNDAWGRISVIVDGIKNTLAADMAPLMHEVAKDILAMVGPADDVRQSIQDLTNWMAYAVGHTKEMLKTLSQPMWKALLDPNTYDVSRFGRSGMDMVARLAANRAKLEQAASERIEDRERQRIESVAELQRKKIEEQNAALRREAEGIAESFRKQFATPAEKLEEKIQDIVFAMMDGGLEFETAMKAVGSEVDKIAGEIKQLQKTPDIGPTLRGSAEDALAQARRANQAAQPQENVRQQLEELANNMFRKERELAQILGVPGVNDRQEKLAQETAKQTKEVASALKSNHKSEAGFLRSIDEGIQRLVSRPEIEVTAVGI